MAVAVEETQWKSKGLDAIAEEGEKREDIPEPVALAQNISEKEGEEEEVKEESASRAQAEAFLGVAKDAERSPEEMISTPLPGETLAVFYARSREYPDHNAFTSVFLWEILPSGLNSFVKRR